METPIAASVICGAKGRRRGTDAEACEKAREPETTAGWEEDEKPPPPLPAAPRPAKETVAVELPATARPPKRVVLVESGGPATAAEFAVPLRISIGLRPAKDDRTKSSLSAIGGGGGGGTSGGNSKAPPRPAGDGIIIGVGGA